MNDNKAKYTENYMIRFDEAISLIDQNSCTRTPIEIETLDSSGHVLAEDLAAPESIPPFNNSAMDGYAVNFSDLLNASADNPVALKLVGITAAGDNSADVKNSSGTACKIMTGAPIQDQYDAIIPVENTKLEGNTVYCFSSPQKGAHIRKIGEDFLQGEQIIDKGSVVNANIVAALSTLGIAKVKVYPKTSISIFSTGKELVDDINTALKPGQIRNSNKPYILEWLKLLPVTVFDAGTNYDEVEKFEKDLQVELDKNTDIIISSGAVSMGDFDFIPSTIKKLGGQIIFHKAKIRPGKPILFAKFPNGTFYFGLPGNPISAAIGLRFFVSHLILRLQGKPQEKPIATICINGKDKKQGFRTIWKARASANKNAQVETEILDGQESFKIKPLVSANGWAVLLEELDK
ncbi:MAG: molybdopterin molybdotransferase MoeA, partial [Kangiellaceae bacterium]|nr:molybdopterin molybdotransferase MoeA [Kangiellaceae bacterium]